MFQDILTDFTVDAENIPIEGGDTNWFGHKVQYMYTGLFLNLWQRSLVKAKYFSRL